MSINDLQKKALHDVPRAPTTARGDVWAWQPMCMPPWVNPRAQLYCAVGLRVPSESMAMAWATLKVEPGE